MTKRYYVQRDPHQTWVWDVLATSDSDPDGDWVAAFASQSHADRFAAELNREEASKEAERLMTDPSWMGLTAIMLPSTQHKDAIPPPADPEHPAPDMMDAVFGKWPGDETDEELAKALSATHAYQVRHVWDPSKFCEPTTKAWNLSNIVDTTTLPPGWERTEDGYKYTGQVPTFVKLTGIREPEKHPNEGPVCCRKHAPIQWAFNAEVWGKLRESCDD